MSSGKDQDRVSGLVVQFQLAVLHLMPGDSVEEGRFLKAQRDHSTLNDGAAIQ
jgi:hypothetical protein